MELKNPMSVTLMYGMLCSCNTNWMSIPVVWDVGSNSGPYGMMCTGELYCCHLIQMFLYFIDHFYEIPRNTLSVIKVW